MDAISVQISGVSKSFASTRAVDNVSLSIRKGEFFALLGPSGCGKTTLLRIIAGLEMPTRGSVHIAGREMTFEPPYRRPVNMVFQSYALFPHMSVAENVAFGLRYRHRDGVSRESRSDQTARVLRALEMVRLRGFESRLPSQLSGGQRQRVALARALILKPDVLLLDEPLAALDQKLRKEVQVELKQIQRELGITFVFVTHDQEEALTMSDRIALMNHGRVEQLGEAAHVFEYPQTEFVAQFMGAPNFFTARVKGSDAETLEIDLEGVASFRIPRRSLPFKAGDPASFIVRPEKLRLHRDASGAQHAARISVVIEDRLYQGVNTTWSVRSPDGRRYYIYEQNDQPFSAHEDFRSGATAIMSWDPRHAVVLAAAPGGGASL